MKAIGRWLCVWAVICCGALVARASDPNQVPLWQYDLSIASIFYQMGYNQIGVDSGSAVRYLKAAQKYDLLALEKGASVPAVELSNLITQAFTKLRTDGQSSPSNVTVQTPSRQPAAALRAGHASARAVR